MKFPHQNSANNNLKGNCGTPHRDSDMWQGGVVASAFAFHALGHRFEPGLVQRNLDCQAMIGRGSFESFAKRCISNQWGCLLGWRPAMLQRNMYQNGPSLKRHKKRISAPRHRYELLFLLYKQRTRVVLLLEIRFYLDQLRLIMYTICVIVHSFTAVKLVELLSKVKQCFWSALCICGALHCAEVHKQ